MNTFLDLGREVEATKDSGVVPELDGETENQQLGEMTTLKSTKSTKAGNQDR